MKIRKMETKDLETVALQERNIFSDYWSLDAFRESLNNKQAYLVVSVDEQDEPTGYACVYTALDEAELMNIAVFPEYRGQNLGDALMLHLISYLKTVEIHFFYLEVRQSNVPAQSLYMKHGFEIVGKRKNFYEMPREDAWVMTREI